MPDPITPNTLMTSLRAHLDMLNETITECATDATVYQIAPYENGEVPELIETKKITGTAAIEASKSAYRDLSRHEHQHPSNVLRVPGLLIVDKSLDASIDRINTTKDQLKALLKDDYPNARSRNAFCRTEFRGRMMLQVYRHIRYAEKPVTHATFTWEPITRSTSIMSRADAIELLAKRQAWPNQQLREPNDIEAERIALQQIAATSTDTEFAIIKNRAPHPRLSIYYNENDNTDKLTVPANLPLVIPSNEESLTISHLNNLDTVKPRKSRADKYNVNSIYTPLNLYQIL